MFARLRAAGPLKAFPGLGGVQAPVEPLPRRRELVAVGVSLVAVARRMEHRVGMPGVGHPLGVLLREPGGVASLPRSGRRLGGRGRAHPSILTAGRGYATTAWTRRQPGPASPPDPAAHSLHRHRNSAVGHADVRACDHGRCDGRVTRSRALSARFAEGAVSHPDRLSENGERRWAQQALARLRAEEAEDAIPLRRYPLPQSWGVRLYFRDESQRPSGSIKHRLARRIMEDAVVRGEIRQDTTVVDAGAGNTAIATAYFAKLIGVPFIAVVPGKTSAAKRDGIGRYGGTCHTFDPPAAIYIEGIGRPRVEPAFLASVIDLAMPVSDAASVAAMRHLGTATGWSTGPSTGTNFWAALRLVDRMRARGETGSIATLICDGADAYRGTYFDDGWLRQRQLDPGPYTRTIDRFLADGQWTEPS